MATAKEPTIGEVLGMLVDIDDRAIDGEPVALYWPFVTFGGSHLGSDLALRVVEVSGLEPPTSTMRT